MIGSIRLRRVALIVLLPLAAAACSKSAPEGGGSPAASASTGSGTIAVGSDTANDHGTKDVSGQASVELEQDDFYFSPTVLTGTPGQKVTLELKNEGSALHNFTLSDQGIDQDVQPDGTESVSVTLPQSGFLEFFCKYHKASGMVGELAAS